MRKTTAFFAFALLVLALLVIALPNFAAAEEVLSKTSAHYQVAIIGEDAEVTWLLNYTVAVKSIKLTLTFGLPANATLLSISDVHGPITNYRLTQMSAGDEVKLETRNDGEGGPLALAIKYIITDFAQKKYGRLRVTTQLCLASTDESSLDVVLPPDAVLLASTPKASIGSDRAQFKWVDECLRLIYVRGEEYEGAGGYFSYSTPHYAVFAPEISSKMKQELAEVEQNYGLLSEITGISPPYGKWVVVEAPDEKNVKKEAGVYTGSGLIFIRPTALDENIGPLIMHETMHGFNSEPLSWYAGEGFWFDEGTASYAAHLYALANGIEEGDIFVKNSRFYSSTYDELTDYYERNYARMETWDFETLDAFSYDYSQFLMRAYVDAHGTEALKQAYACLPRTPEQNVTDSQKRNNYILTCLSLADSNASFESILYPGKELFLTDEHAFERYTASIGSASWKGEAKPLPKSAYDLPPLPYEREANESISALSAAMQENSGRFNSSQANLTFSKAIAAYESAKNSYSAGKYFEANLMALQAEVLLKMAKQADADQAAGAAQSAASPFALPCSAGFALLAVLALAFRRRAA
ncbi:MAG: hypothetical protein Q7T16_05435 [Candidatus Burarchaeum sp.]|nr:hypothetical protein [Candidatus Burarchaeum sp.]MDO8340069.1 hypothetical protein [Candidatus Burarchaeum sp.]